MPGARVTPAQRSRIITLLEEGYAKRAVAKMCNVAESTITRNKDKWGIEASGWQNNVDREGRRFADPIPKDKLKGSALRALDDFDLFRRRYMGHMSSPWQVEAAEQIVTMLASDHREYCVISCPPGAGKTTMLTDVAAWVTARDRKIRGVFGSKSVLLATRNVRRVRRALERASPAQAKIEELELGIGCDAEATLSGDYGRFRPFGRGADLWQRDQFVVSQVHDKLIEEKEPTWSAVGMDSAFLGNRFDLIFWDDLVTKETIRSSEAAENIRAWYDEEAETRLEPRGCLFLVGQRRAPNDLYRYCLDKRVPVETDGEDDAPVEDDSPRMYQHIIYKAHDETKCVEGTHRRDAKPWPEGCLLEPYRLPWRDLRSFMATKHESFRVTYQQEDVDPATVLVKNVWVDGGSDDDGTLCFGCWDHDRTTWQLPNFQGQTWRIATVDPSPTKYWAIQLWSYDGTRAHLVDLISARMGGNELLDWDNDNQKFIGVMPEWQAKSVEYGFPIQYWVVEVNAAQKFLLEYDHVKRWIAEQSRSGNPVSIVPHSTTIKKLDPTLGMDTMREWWKSGRIRLPGHRPSGARQHVMPLVDEVTRYPHGLRDDQAMACWFMLVHLPKIAIPPNSQVDLPRPSWARNFGDTRRLVAV